MEIELRMSSNEPAVDVSKDLPLLANADDIRARHYMFKLECKNMQQQYFRGQVIIFLEPMHQEKVYPKFGFSINAH